MHWTQCSVIECSGFHAPWKMEPYWMQWILCSMAQIIPIEYSVFHEASMNARIPCIVAQRIPIVCKESMQRGPMHPDWMQCVLCSMAKSIPIECSWFHALGLNAVYSMQRGKMNPDWMQWIPWSVIECSIPWSVKKWNPIECSGFHAAWLHAVDFMHHGPKHPDWMQWIPCIVIEFILLHAAW